MLFDLHPSHPSIPTFHSRHRLFPHQRPALTSTPIRASSSIPAISTARLLADLANVPASSFNTHLRSTRVHLVANLEDGSSTLIPRHLADDVAALVRSHSCSSPLSSSCFTSDSGLDSASSTPGAVSDLDLDARIDELLRRAQGMSGFVKRTSLGQGQGQHGKGRGRAAMHFQLPIPLEMRTSSQGSQVGLAHSDASLLGWHAEVYGSDEGQGAEVRAVLDRLESAELENDYPILQPITPAPTPSPLASTPPHSPAMLGAPTPKAYNLHQPTWDLDAADATDDLYHPLDSTSLDLYPYYPLPRTPVQMPTPLYDSIPLDGRLTPGAQTSPYIPLPPLDFASGLDSADTTTSPLPPFTPSPTFGAFPGIGLLGMGLDDPFQLTGGSQRQRQLERRGAHRSFRSSTPSPQSGASLRSATPSPVDPSMNWSALGLSGLGRDSTDLGPGLGLAGSALDVTQHEDPDAFSTLPIAPSRSRRTHTRAIRNESRSGRGKLFLRRNLRLVAMPQDRFTFHRYEPGSVSSSQTSSVSTIQTDEEGHGGGVDPIYGEAAPLKQVTWGLEVDVEEEDAKYALPSLLALPSVPDQTGMDVDDKRAILEMLSPNVRSHVQPLLPSSLAGAGSGTIHVSAACKGSGGIMRTASIPGRPAPSPQRKRKSMTGGAFEVLSSDTEVDEEDEPELRRGGWRKEGAKGLRALGMGAESDLSSFSRLGVEGQDDEMDGLGEMEKYQASKHEGGDGVPLVDRARKAANDSAELDDGGQGRTDRERSSVSPRSVDSGAMSGNSQEAASPPKITPKLELAPASSFCRGVVENLRKRRSATTFDVAPSRNLPMSGRASKSKPTKGVASRRMTHIGADRDRSGRGLPLTGNTTSAVSLTSRDESPDVLALPMDEDLVKEEEDIEGDAEDEDEDGDADATPAADADVVAEADASDSENEDAYYENAKARRRAMDAARRERKKREAQALQDSAARAREERNASRHRAARPRTQTAPARPSAAMPLKPLHAKDGIIKGLRQPERIVRRRCTSGDNEYTDKTGRGYCAEELAIIIPCWDGRSPLSNHALQTCQQKLIEKGYRERTTDAIKWYMKHTLYDRIVENAAKTAAAAEQKAKRKRENVEVEVDVEGGGEAGEGSRSKKRR